MVVRLLASLFCTLLLAPGLGAQLRSDWTQAEIECAGSIDIPLNSYIGTAGKRYLRQLVWFSDAVIVGSATEIEPDLDGPYPKIVTFRVTHVFKGHPLPDAVTVKLYSGPFYEPATGRILIRQMEDEPNLDLNYKTVLFLTRGYAGMEPTSELALGTDEFTLLESLVYSESNLISKDRTAFDQDAVIRDIEFVVQKQSSDCAN
ncbi:MAG: hypothetical protein OER88_02015 [Planctomycetota bacterium]|nr:hypothetical protein [Planctomycetota bacterium]